MSSLSISEMKTPEPDREMDLEEMGFYAGRMGGNQAFIVDRSNPANRSLLAKQPDAAPNLNLREMFSLQGFVLIDLYKAAVIEFFGTFVLVFGSAFNSMSPNIAPPPPTEAGGPFNTVNFLGPGVAAILNTILLALLIYSFGAVSGGHMNPLITIGTFFARLTSFPRLVLYTIAQVGGGAAAGICLRVAAGTRDFKAGGCYLFTDMVDIKSALVVETIGDLLLLIISFGVGLDPRQRDVFGPALGPLFVGLGAGATALTFAFNRIGYGGASLNPARCLGVFVGSSFPTWHWIHWAGPMISSIAHGVLYWAVPPSTRGPL